MTPTEYIATLPEEKQPAIKKLYALIRRVAPSFQPYVAGTMLGFGRYRYRYESGREGESCRVGLASTKAGFSLYVAAVEDGAWLAEQATTSLGKVSVGKSCIRFKRLDDLDLAGLEALLARAHTMLGPSEIPASTPR